MNKSSIFDFHPGKVTLINDANFILLHDHLGEEKTFEDAIKMVDSAFKGHTCKKQSSLINNIKYHLAKNLTTNQKRQSETRQFDYHFTSEYNKCSVARRSFDKLFKKLIKYNFLKLDVYYKDFIVNPYMKVKKFVLEVGEQYEEIIEPLMKGPLEPTEEAWGKHNKEDLIDMHRGFLAKKYSDETESHLKQDITRILEKDTTDYPNWNIKKDPELLFATLKLMKDNEIESAKKQRKKEFVEKMKRTYNEGHRQAVIDELEEMFLNKTTKYLGTGLTVDQKEMEIMNTPSKFRKVVKRGKTYNVLHDKAKDKELAYNLIVKKDNDKPNDMFKKMAETYRKSNKDSVKLKYQNEIREFFSIPRPVINNEKMVQPVKDKDETIMYEFYTVKNVTTKKETDKGGFYAMSNMREVKLKECGFCSENKVGDLYAKFHKAEEGAWKDYDASVADKIYNEDKLYNTEDPPYFHNDFTHFGETG